MRSAGQFALHGRATFRQWPACVQRRIQAELFTPINAVQLQRVLGGLQQSRREGRLFYAWYNRVHIMGLIRSPERGPLAFRLLNVVRWERSDF